MKSQVQESVQVWDSIQKSKQKKEQDESELQILNEEAVAICKSFGKML